MCEFILLDLKLELGQIPRSVDSADTIRIRYFITCLKLNLGKIEGLKEDELQKKEDWLESL